jgi:phosphatidylserine decarboxylase
MGMSVTQPLPNAAPLTAVKPTSTQPGGGLIVRLELFWGRLRRAYLRLFRTGYLKRMESQRIGDCPNCKHYILDPRDLKYKRNVCGFSFRVEDDPFNWRNHLGFARAGLAEVVLTTLVALFSAFFTVAAVNLIHPVFWLLVPIISIPWLFTLWFFRDPERDIPIDPDALLSPADGTVTHIDEVQEADFPGGRAVRLSIFLAVWDVHVNRIPRTGRIVNLRYYPGAFLDARKPESSKRNEQFWVDLEENTSGRRIRVKQVSGAIARRIVNWLRFEEPVFAGDRFGMIKFGSRTEVLVSVDAVREVVVKVGDKVKGGSTILLRVN